jgi:hypothetical protein
MIRKTIIVLLKNKGVSSSNQKLSVKCFTGLVYNIKRSTGSKGEYIR